MKFGLLFAITLSYGAFAAPIESRQLSGLSGLIGQLAPLVGQLAGAILPAQKAFKTENFQPTIPRDGIKRTVIWYGPYKIRPANSTQKTESGFSMDPAGTGWSYMATDFPKDITVLRVNTSIVYEDGTRAQLSNGLYDHHLVFTNMKKNTPTMASCDGKPSAGMSIFIGGSEDLNDSLYTTKDGKFNSGYYISKDDPIMMSGDIVNYTNDTKVVFTRSDIEYIQGKVPDMYEVSNQVLNVGMCDGKGVISSAPPSAKQFTLSGKDIIATGDGYILYSRGHLHDGGVDILMKINGKEACRSAAQYGGAGATTTASDGNEWQTISRMTKCDGPIKVTKGDKITLEASYDLDKHPARKQVGGGMAETMAIESVTFASKAS